MSSSDEEYVPDTDPESEQYSEPEIDETDETDLRDSKFAEKVTQTLTPRVTSAELCELAKAYDELDFSLNPSTTHALQTWMRVGAAKMAPDQLRELLHAYNSPLWARKLRNMLGRNPVEKITAGLEHMPLTEAHMAVLDPTTIAQTIARSLTRMEHATVEQVHTLETLRNGRGNF